MNYYSDEETWIADFEEMDLTSDSETDAWLYTDSPHYGHKHRYVTKTPPPPGFRRLQCPDAPQKRPNQIRLPVGGHAKRRLFH